jgi:26S proteasome regulatory subunit T4
MADAAEERLAVLDEYRKKMRELRELEARLKSNRVAVTDLVKEFNDTEDALKALQSLGQIIGEVLKQLDDTRFIVKVYSTTRFMAMANLSHSWIVVYITL